jgi:hypothetical protein
VNDNVVFLLAIPVLVVILLLSKLVITARGGRPVSIKIGGFGVSFTITTGCPFYEADTATCYHDQPLSTQIKETE